MIDSASSDSSRAVVVMGKIPRPGRVKTRLARGLSAETAAALYRAFLADTFRLVDRAGGGEWRRVFACAIGPEDALADAEALAPDGWRVVAQAGDGLGERIEHARRMGGARHVVVMGSDSPTLPDARLTEAFAALDEPPPPVVFVPTDDGGYAAVGFCGPVPAVLDGIPWSTGRVMAASRAAAAAAGVRVVELPVAYDVDHAEDLPRLRRDVDPALHPATASALARYR